MKTSLFNYQLPKSFIAQKPLRPRDSSKLMLLDRKDGRIKHDVFNQITDYLTPNDVLVLNNTKVLPWRLMAAKKNNAKVEILIIKKLSSTGFNILCKPGLKKDEQIIFKNNVQAQVVKINIDWTRTIKFIASPTEIKNLILKHGLIPTPPYIKAGVKKHSWYQTVYAKYAGSAAAPTAGFHFTKRLLNKLKTRGVGLEYITLHVGIDTFRPVMEKQVADHKIHTEWYSLSLKTAKRLNQAKKEGKRIIAVGTTTVRVLESSSLIQDLKTGFLLSPKTGYTNLFIYPGYRFRFVDALITNFHLPRSSLLMLVAAFCSQHMLNEQTSQGNTSGLQLILKAYQEAMKKSYRFYSFGDAMMIC